MNRHFFLLGGLMLLTAGCVHSRSREAVSAANAWQSLPPVIAVLTGPEALLLTNVDGLAADLTLTLTADPAHPRRVEGDLRVSRGRLYFESRPDDRKVADRFSLIWDTAKNSGWVMSEALQGLAPLSSTNTSTVLMGTPAVAGRLAGYPVGQTQATLAGSNGRTVECQIWSAPDLHQLALKIEPLTGAEPMTLELSRIRLEVPAETLFLPPDDFAKYTSAVALLDELISRQRAVFNDRGEFHGTPGELEAPGAQSRFQNNPTYQH